MKDYAHRHPNKLDTRGGDTLPDSDIESPALTESELFDVFTGAARTRALELLGGKARTRVDCTHEYINSLGQLTKHEAMK